GRIYDNKAFPIHLEPSKTYKWCTCGISKSQPMCDGSHTRLDGTEPIKKRPLYRPLVFTVNKAETYHLCNCKQTNNKPFCDGTHRNTEVQTAVSS
ncbi:hypothetical protein HELRODRAFT_75376, partial [Helobdella robusta]|uniref:Iron-binding zinc finger CDGSH type domain-containing protein n=1 Tax=Helobdella robusta TaxID=6412 RepID=T1G242_HELRO